MAPGTLQRVIRVFNIVVAVVALAAIAGLWWFGLRPLPDTAGTMGAPVTSSVTISRDGLGVPHIKATCEEDALFAQGYVTAQDRLFQMDGLRRLASGTLAEVLGRRAIESDRETRRLRLRRIAEAAYASLQPPDRAALAAYARGVNYFIDTHRGSLPVEFRLLGYEPRPWSVVDSLLMGLHMFRTLTTTWRDEIIKRNLMAGGDANKVHYLFPARSGGEVQPGSNAWALAGRWTASGRPLLSNDMHLEWSLPGIWYMCHLQAPELDVAGVALPGVPGIVGGHNRRIAWGITNLQFDVQDLYQEKFDDRTGRYLFRGQVEQARLEREFINVRGGDRVEVAQWVTRHGPLFIVEGDDRMSLRWIAAEPGAIQFPILEINRARNWTEFRAAVSRFRGPGSNFVYADVDGNIGYHAAGLLPVRRKHLGDLPVDGASGDNEWDGFIPFDQLPSAFNPPGGVIVTANQNPFPEAYPFAVNGNFASHYRARQIRDRLTSRKGWKPEELLKVQADVYSGFSRFLAGEVVRAYENRKARNPELEDAIAVLRGWNGQMDRELAAPFIVSLAYQHLRRVVAENAAPGKGLMYDFRMAPAVLERLLRERPAGWFRDYDEMLLRTLVDAVEEGTRIQGRDVKRWRYGAYLKVTLIHPVLHQLPLVGPYFDVGTISMSGSSTTIQQTSSRLGPSMRMNVDLGDLERSLLNVPIGQSGQVFSSHYRDQWKHYYSGQSFPMQFEKVDAKDVLELRPSGH